MKSIIRFVAFVPMVGMMCIIWGFSANTGEVSSEQSQGIVSRIIDCVEDITGVTLSEEEQQIWEERIHTPIRKLAHTTEYMIFALTVAFPLVQYIKRCKIICWITFLFCIIYASLDEIHQRFVPNRSGQFRDVVIDGIGIGIGLLIFSLVYRMAAKYNNQTTRKLIDK
ncbi:MAG: VanZ family protein [Lachnospiraceae bacterium]|nr:VanZ family protein [Lachnospiraceae bacterium]